VLSSGAPQIYDRVISLATRTGFIDAQQQPADKIKPPPLRDHWMENFFIIAWRDVVC
jgi:hypothetical protein